VGATNRVWTGHPPPPRSGARSGPRRAPVSGDRAAPAEPSGV